MTHSQGDLQTATESAIVPLGIISKMIWGWSSGGRGAAWHTHVLGASPTSV